MHLVRLVEDASPPPPPPSACDAPCGKYVLIERLAIGGMAEVFLAKAPGIEGFEKLVAIKRILPFLAGDAEFVSMFIDEARLGAQLNHGNVVDICDLGREGRSLFIAMEYVPGRNLRAVVEWYRDRNETMPPVQAAYIASKVCDGLDYAHRKTNSLGQPLNVIHRDVTPANVICSYDGEVKLVDFGIAKTAMRESRTTPGVLKGKFLYVSPEQVQGKPIDQRTDIYALGVTLYEMLTGVKPFDSDSNLTTLQMILTAEIVPPSQLNPAIPPELEAIVLKAMARDPAQRYQWASELSTELMRFLFAQETIYSSVQLKGFMGKAFPFELWREAQRMKRASEAGHTGSPYDSQTATVSGRLPLGERLPRRELPIVRPRVAPNTEVAITDAEPPPSAVPELWEAQTILV